MCFSQIGEAYLASLMFTGTLAKFPALKFVFAEFGFAWALPHIWRMDTMWKAIRVETPWVKRWPSEYVHEQIRFTTQPLDEPRTKGDLEKLIEMLGPEVLLFSTDYPHWDGDAPDQVLRGLPDAAREQIFSTNARACFPRI
jgi:predicted TIM-barrel fold metal-dependent hydrolase